MRGHRSSVIGHRSSVIGHRSGQVKSIFFDDESWLRVSSDQSAANPGTIEFDFDLAIE